MFRDWQTYTRCLSAYRWQFCFANFNVEHDANRNRIGDVLPNTDANQQSECAYNQIGTLHTDLPIETNHENPSLP